jgi:hypothetical protein
VTYLDTSENLFSFLVMEIFRTKKLVVFVSLFIDSTLRLLGIVLS